MTCLDWVGMLPEQWEAKPLRSVSKYIVSNVDKTTSDDEIRVRLCNYTDVYHNEYITLDLDFMNATASEHEIEKFGLSTGDVILTKDSESWNDIGVPTLVQETADDLVCGYHLALLRPHKDVMDSAFLFRCIQAKPIRLQLELSAKGVTRFGLPRSEIGAMVLPVPPLSEQQAISDYLDRETDRLDALVAAKQRMLNLLAERRQAIIAVTVMGGIDSTAQSVFSPPGAFLDDEKQNEAKTNRRRDRTFAGENDWVTSLDWVGMLPGQWDAKPLRSVSTYIVSNVDKSTSDDEIRVRLCNYTDVYHNEYITLDLDFMSATASEHELERFGLSIGDVIITKDSESWDDIGIPTLVRETADDLVCGYHLALLRPHKDVMDSAFLFRCIQAKPIRLQLELSAKGVTRFGLPKSEIGSMLLPVPPLSQQHAIAEYLDCETTRLDTLRARIRRTIALLKERRAALIAAAVTGQIAVEDTT